MSTMFQRSAARMDALRNGLHLTAHLLRQRQACDIPAGYIDEFVTLDWLEWAGGTLRLTTTGENICRNSAATRRR